MSDYEYEREGAVSCRADDSDAKHPNCMHAWNAANPGDPVTEAEQAAYRAAVIDAAFEQTLVQHREALARLADL